MVVDAALATDGLADAMAHVRVSQLHAFAQSPDIRVMSGEVGWQLRGRIGDEDLERRRRVTAEESLEGSKASRATQCSIDGKNCKGNIFIPSTWVVNRKLANNRAEVAMNSLHRVGFRVVGSGCCSADVEAGRHVHDQVVDEVRPPVSVDRVGDAVAAENLFDQNINDV